LKELKRKVGVFSLEHLMVDAGFVKPEASIIWIVLFKEKNIKLQV